MSKQQWIAENLKPGEEYAGLILGKEGATDYHLVLLPVRITGVGWMGAMVWAEVSGGDLPSPREQSLLFTNLKEMFDPRQYWSAETRASNSEYGAGQNFDDGAQLYHHKSSLFRARAIRRLPI